MLGMKLISLSLPRLAFGKKCFKVVPEGIFLMFPFIQRTMLP